MKKIEISETMFSDERRLRKAFATRMRLPASCARDWDAWIERMSRLKDSLEIEIVVKDGTGYFETKAWGQLCACAAEVNGRFREAGSDVRLILTEKDVFGAG